MVNAIFFLVLAWITCLGITAQLLYDEYHPDSRGPRRAPRKFAGQELRSLKDLSGLDPTRHTVGDTLPTDLLDFFELVEVDGKPTVRWAW
jgi:hypothetical protein